MPLPTVITDLSITAASNYPAGTDSPATLDDVQRAHAAFIAQTRDGNGSVPEIDIASGATVNIGAAASPYLRVTGTTGITSFGTNYKGVKFLRFAGIVTITHNATSLICPNNTNITTVAGDIYCAYPKATAGVGDGWVLVPVYQSIPVGSVVEFSAYNSVSTAMATNALTKIDFQTEEYDTAGAFASSRFTATTAGYYTVSGGYAPGAAPVACFLSLHKNGVRYKDGAIIGDATLVNSCGISARVYLAVGDYIELYGYQNSGGAQGTTTGANATWFQGGLTAKA